MQLALRGGGSSLIDDADYEYQHEFESYSVRICDCTAVLEVSRGGRVMRARVEFRRDSELKRVFLHRLIAEPPAGMLVDHINGDSLDNRRDNLRCCTHRQNSQNMRKYSGKHRFKGIRQEGRRWRAEIRREGRTQHIGTFDNDVDAALAYDNAARELFGEFARPNFANAGEVSCLV